MDCADLILVKSLCIRSFRGSEPLIEAREQRLRLGGAQSVEQCAEQSAGIA